MITVRRSAERGRFDYGWLLTRHTFSFGDYTDPAHLGFRSVRVINEDRVKPGQGFGTHGHADMEIISVVLEGELSHCDSMGNGSIIRPGDVQRMSAGTGVTHSEQNHSASNPVHFLQIWIEPDRRGLSPSYEQKRFGEEPRSAFTLVASPDGASGSLLVHQDARVYSTALGRDVERGHPLAPDRQPWLQVTRGALKFNGPELEAGDGAAVSGVPELRVVGLENAGGAPVRPRVAPRPRLGSGQPGRRRRCPAKGRSTTCLAPTVGRAHARNPERRQGPPGPRGRYRRAGLGSGEWGEAHGT